MWKIIQNLRNSVWTDIVRFCGNFFITFQQKFIKTAMTHECSQKKKRKKETKSCCTWKQRSELLETWLYASLVAVWKLNFKTSIDQGQISSCWGLGSFIPWLLCKSFWFLLNPTDSKGIIVLFRWSANKLYLFLQLQLNDEIWAPWLCAQTLYRVTWARMGICGPIHFLITPILYPWNDYILLQCFMEIYIHWIV